MPDTGDLLTESWVDRAISSSAALAEPGPRSAAVAMTIGKTRRAELDIVDGRVVAGRVFGDGAGGGAGSIDDASVGVTVPVTEDQLAAFADGSQSLARAYMEGDVKPVGSTGALLALVELFEDAEFRKGLSEG